MISEFDLYKSGWLELVFAKRNKAYGAYYLRQHYADNVVKAMVITFVSVGVILAVLNSVVTAKPVVIHKGDKIVDIQLQHVKPPVPPKEEVHKAQPSRPAAPKQLVATTGFPPPVVVPQTPPIEPPKLVDMKGEIGQETIDVPEGTASVPSVNNGPGGDGTAAKEADANTVYEYGVDIEPEPYGGNAAWTKFLQKNVKYPRQASDANISGKVWVSFIVEKNGHISTVKVERGPGYGMNEEAERVLKLAPPWKPGMQHGVPVRVKYTLPLNFILNGDN